MYKLRKRFAYILTIFVTTVLLLGTATFNTQTFAANSTIGVVDFQLLMSQHPEMAAAQATLKAETEQAQKDFDEKSPTFTNEEEKKAYFNQMQQRLNEKQQTLLTSIQEKIIAAVKGVADAKGITIVVDKDAAIYGGQDITSDVGKKITAN